MGTKKRKTSRVTIPEDIINPLREAGEIKVDAMGRVKGFDMYLRRQMKRGKLL